MELSATALSVLHERVLLGDRSASEDFARHMLSALRPRLRAAFPRADQDTINDAAEDAILQHLVRPQRFDSARGVPLDRFLYLVAWRRLANRLRNAAARARQHATYLSTITLDPRVDEPNHSPNGEWAALIGRMAVALNDSERSALYSWFTGEPPLKLAIALGFGGQPSREQQQEIKRFKDRIRARLRRLLIINKTRPLAAPPPAEHEHGPRQRLSTAPEYNG